MNEILSAGLTGSVVGVVLKSIFDIVAKKQEHRYHRENLTQKDLFDKKIRIAEAAIAQFTQVKVIFYMIREIIDTLLHAIRYKLSFDMDVLLNITKEFSGLVERAKSYDTASVSLYFDIKEDIGNQHLIQDFFGTVSALAALGNSFEIKTKDKSITNEDRKKMYSILITSLVIISKLLKSVEDDIAENIRIIKSDMKEFKAI